MIKDLIVEVKGIETGTDKLRSFGFVVGSVFVLLAIFELWFFGIWALIVGGVLILGALIYPRSLHFVYLLWMTLGVTLGFFVSRILLILLYILIMTPIGFVMRLVKKETMLKRAGDHNTFWVKREPVVNKSLEELS